jgi:prepilin-type N-terminal cleavage/methylation domain-containing protein
MKPKHGKSQAGFSLIEMMMVVAILILVMGVIMRQIVVVQSRARGEVVKLDMVQQARESLDQMLRDLHQAGFPSAYMYVSTVLTSPTNNNTNYAVGLVQVTNSSTPILIFEGDVDGTGTVSSVRYRYVTSSTESTHCPCIERSQVTKTSADPLTGQGTAYHVLIENVATGGLSFTGFDANGNTVTISSSGLDINNNTTTLKSIKTLQITLKVQGQYPDLQTKQFPAISLNGLAQIRN